VGLVAGLSTGEATEQLKRARKADPFLWADARPPGQQPFQGGVLEPHLKKWEQLRGGPVSKSAISTRGLSPTMREGIRLFDARQWSKAQAKFHQAAEEDEYDHRPVLYQLRILVRTGRPSEAVPGFRELAAEFPDEADVRLYLAVALARAGGNHEAQPLLEAALKESPRNAEALSALAQVHMDGKKWPEAIELLRTLVGLDPRDEAGWLQLGIAQAGMEQWKAADESFRRVLSLNPVSKPAQEWRQKIKKRLEGKEKATK